MIDFLFPLLLCSMLGTGCRKSVEGKPPRCDCYVTSGASSAYYTHHQFFDFRYLRNGTAVYDHEPADISNGQDQRADVWQQGYVNSTAFADNWDILTWGREPSPTHPIGYRNSGQNVFVRQYNPPLLSTFRLIVTCRDQRGQRLRHPSHAADSPERQLQLNCRSQVTAARTFTLLDMRALPGARRIRRRRRPLYLPERSE